MGVQQNTNQWSSTTIEGGSYQFNNNSEGEHVSIPATGQSFYTGGFGIAINGTYDGLIAFESGSDPSWNFDNTNTAGLSPPSILKWGMKYIRRGQKGVLVAFGGFDVSWNRWLLCPWANCLSHHRLILQSSHVGVQFLRGGGWDWDYRETSQIYIYDIFGNTWQETLSPMFWTRILGFASVTNHISYGPEF